MSSTRAASLAAACLRLRPTPKPQPVYQPLRTRGNLLGRPSRQQPPSLLFTRRKHTIPRPPPRASPPSPSSSSSSATSTTTTTNAGAGAIASAEIPSKEPDSRSPPPQYELTFTCIPCDTRSKHKVSKQGYHHGSILIACPGCKNRHVIADHLKIFGDRKITVEDLMREKGRLVRRGTLDGDIEFWDDGSTTVRESEEVGGDGKQGEANLNAEEKGTESAPGATFKNRSGDAAA